MKPWNWKDNSEVHQYFYYNYEIIIINVRVNVTKTVTTPLEVRHRRRLRRCRCRRRMHRHRYIVMSLPLSRSPLSSISRKIVTKQATTVSRKILFPIIRILFSAFSWSRLTTKHELKQIQGIYKDIVPMINGENISSASSTTLHNLWYSLCCDTCLPKSSKRSTIMWQVLQIKRIGRNCALIPIIRKRKEKKGN